MNHRLVSRTALSFTLALSAGPVIVSAHDYWLEPVTTADGSTALRLFVGECLMADEEKRYEPLRTTRLETWDAKAHADLRERAQEGAQIRTVHMHRVTDGDPKADWESLWTSYSFVVGAK